MGQIGLAYALGLERISPEQEEAAGSDDER